MTEGSHFGDAADAYATWQALLRTVTGDDGESLPHALQRTARSAREIVGCRYAVIAVVDETGALEHLVPAGDDPAAVQPIGRRPLRDGLLGTVIVDARTVRLPAPGVAPEAVGLPADHPVVNSLLGVPIRCGGRTVGALYVSEPEDDRPFTTEHERAAELVAAAAAAVVQRARLADAAAHRQRWLAAAAELTRALLGAAPQDPVRLVLDRVLVVGAADLAAIIAERPDGTGYQVLDATGARAGELAGSVLDRSWPALRRVIDDGVPELLVAQPQAALAELPGAEAALLVPLDAPGLGRAALAVCRGAGRPAFTSGELDAAAALAVQIAPVLPLAAQDTHRERAALREERDRIARDLHDHVIQRLFAIGLSLQSTGTQADVATAQRLVASVDELDETIAQIRATIYRLTGPVLPAESSLRARVGRLIDEVEPVLGFRPEVTVRGPADFGLDDELTDDCVAVLREALTNVARHARATRVEVGITVSPTELLIEIADDGRGLGAGARRSGLANLRTRAERHGGRLTVNSSRSHGTRLSWAVPLGTGVHETRSAG